MKRLKPIYLCIVTGLALVACSQREAALPSDITTALEVAFARGDAAACAAIYADDAEIISEDAPVVRGREAIVQFFKDQIVREISFDTDTTLNVISGDFAIEQGTYQVRNVNVGSVVEYGEFLNVWKKTNDGWKNYRSMYNTTQASKTRVSVGPADDDS